MVDRVREVKVHDPEEDRALEEMDQVLVVGRAPVVHDQAVKDHEVVHDQA